MKITAKGQTFFKARPVQSSTLPTQDRVATGVSSQYEGEIVRSDGIHTLFELKEPIMGKRQWWIYNDHWEGLGYRKVYKPESINWYDYSAKVSKYFTVNEVINGDSRRIPTELTIKRNILDLAVELDKIREAWGSPIGVTSWYRPEPINQQVGGVPGSAHTQGYAADIFPYHGDPIAFENWLDHIWDNALGYGQNSGRGFTHIDLRPGRLRWDY